MAAEDFGMSQEEGTIDSAIHAIRREAFYEGMAVLIRDLETRLGMGQTLEAAIHGDAPEWYPYRICGVKEYLHLFSFDAYENDR